MLSKEFFSFGTLISCMPFVKYRFLITIYFGSLKGTFFALYLFKSNEVDHIMQEREK